jgi:glycosyltransferase involved in cell wall biosynthesis
MTKFQSIAFWSAAVKRILIIINGWTTRIAGGDYHTLRVAQNWSEKNEISYLIPRLGYQFAKNALKGKALILDSGFESEASNPFRIILMYCVRVVRFCVSPPPMEKYDVVVASSHFLADLLPALYVRFKNPSCKFVVYWHGLPIKQSSLWRYVLRQLNDTISAALLRRRVNLVFAINQSVKSFLVARGVDAQKIRITNNGTDLISFTSDPKPPIFDACYVGRLEKIKGIFDLVTIWKDVSTRMPSAKLAIVGDGSEKDRLTSSIEAEHLTCNVILFGYVEEQRKFEIMLSSKLFLLPSYADDWGIAILDAMSCGLPAIIYDSPALRTVWGDDVTYVPAGDTASFGRTLLRLLQDQQLRAELSSIGLRRSAQYSWTKIAAKEAEAIKSL